MNSGFQMMIKARQAENAKGKQAPPPENYRTNTRVASARNNSMDKIQAGLKRALQKQA